MLGILSSQNTEHGRVFGRFDRETDKAQPTRQKARKQTGVLLEPPRRHTTHTHPTTTAAPKSTIRARHKHVHRLLRRHRCCCSPSVSFLSVSFCCLSPARVDELFRRRQERALDDISPQVHPRVKLQADLLLIHVPAELRRVDATHPDLHVPFQVLR